MPQPVSLFTFDQSAPTQEWREIADLFVACFSVAPYFEDQSELQTIVGWGPTMLAGNGRLVTARMNGILVGFALAHNLVNDVPWQQTLSRLKNRASTVAALAAPQDALVIHELAVREPERGRGIAGECMRELLRGRVESQTFIGTYERAEAARSMYQHWGFELIGQVPMLGDAIALHVLTSRTSDAVERLTSASRAAPA